MPDNTLSTLSEIRTKVRRLTRSPSEAQLPTADLDKYINTFVLYDFPEHLRTDALREVLSFYVTPYIDNYDTDIVDPSVPLYNFKNKVISVHGPVYIAGNKAFFSQSREQFYALYPKTQNLVNIGTGDGGTFGYDGTLADKPVLRNEVLFSSVDAFNDDLAVRDDGNGNLVGDAVAGGTINYVTGAYIFAFTNAPGIDETIYVQTVPYVPSRPTAILYFNNQFFVRPVPDQPYKVDVEVYLRPTELLAADQSPNLAEWWQYIAYGAAKKIFEDKSDIDSVAAIMAEFKKQETLTQRRTIVQMSNERTATFYTGIFDGSNVLT